MAAVSSQTLTRRELLGQAARSAAAAGASAAFWSARGRTQGRPFYQGKTIEVIVPFAPGGAADVGAQFVAPFLQKYIPGNPVVTVRHMPGGGSVLGANWFYANAKPDGLMMLCTTSSTSFPYMLGQQGVQYDLLKLRPALTQAFGPVVYASPGTGIRRPADLLRPRVPLIYGGIAATGSDLPVLLSFELLRLPIRTVLGFTGRGPVRIAFERGEVNVDFQFTQVYLTQVRPLVEAGKAVPLYTGGSPNAQGEYVQRDPVVSDLPSTYEVYQELYGRAPSGVEWQAYQAAAALTFQFGLIWWMHGSTPPEALEAIAGAVERINRDPEFVERGKQVTGGYPLRVGEREEGHIREALRPPQPVVDYLERLLREKYNVRV
ncbi:MAG TPA: hypothetical protein VIL11_00265 [Limnochordales bacterium]